MKSDTRKESAERWLLNEPVRVGVIGVGRFGENHVRAYLESPFSQLVAIADVDSARAHTVATRYGVQRYYADFQGLLNDPEIKAVSIVTPAHLHAEPAIAAAEAGKHILLEKPIATSLRDAEAIVKAASENGVKLMIGHTLRFEINYASIHSAIEGSTMGRPIAVISRLNNSITEARYVGAHISPVLHMMIHNIDLSLWYMGRTPSRVFCAAARGKVYEEMQVPDGCVVIIDFEGGGLAVTEGFWCLPEKFANWRAPQNWVPLVSDTQMEVICTEGVLYLGAPITSLRACDQDGWKFPQVTFRPIIHGELGGAFREEIKHFLVCCLSEQQPLIDGRDGIASLRVAIAAGESLRRNSPVMLKPNPD